MEEQNQSSDQLRKSFSEDRNIEFTDAEWDVLRTSVISNSEFNPEFVIYETAKRFGFAHSGEYPVLRVRRDDFEDILREVLKNHFPLYSFHTLPGRQLRVKRYLICEGNKFISFIICRPFMDNGDWMGIKRARPDHRNYFFREILLQEIEIYISQNRVFDKRITLRFR